jgi:hypothetical protein
MNGFELDGGEHAQRGVAVLVAVEASTEAR